MATIPQTTPLGNARATVVVRWAGGGVAAVAGLSALTLYGRTLAPAVLVGDSGEFQFTGAILGIPHPTGYPLYTLLGKAWSLLPLGTVAYRINLSSACYLAAAVGLVAWLIWALGGRPLPPCGMQNAECGMRNGAGERRSGWGDLLLRALAAWGGAGLFAVAGTVWAQAVVARSYALNALLVAGCLTALWGWWANGRRAAGWVFAGLLGLSLAHHGTTSVLLPGYGWLAGAALWRWRGQDRGGARVRWWLGMVAAFVLGLSPYLLLAYRFVFGYTYYWGNPQTWADVLYLARGGPFTGQFFAYPLTLAGQWERILFGVEQISRQFGPGGVALGLAGWLCLVADWRTRPFGVGLGLLVAGNFAFAVNYGIIGHIYLIPTYLCWAILMAATGLWAVAWAERLRRPWPRGLGRVTLGLAGALVVLVAVPGLALARLPAQDRSGDTRIRDLALTTLAAAAPGARIYVDWESLCVFRYYRFVEGRRPDLLLYSEDPRDWAPGIAQDLAAGRESYVGGWAGPDPPAAVRAAYRLERVGLVYRVVGRTPGD
ncbi:MAG: DUF2723 domain-containing protein [Chloroflexota bacterium]|nr:DUF2723 domain-containing protein [Chloroflexota bacterium]